MVQLSLNTKTIKKILTLFLLFLFFSGCAEPPLSLIRLAQPHLGTIVEITVADSDQSSQSVHQAVNKAFGEIQRVEDLLSKFKSGSEISRINAGACVQPTKVSLETITLLEKSIGFSRLSQGAFDITLLPLGYQDINILEEEQSVFLARQGMSLDLGGLAKGYAVDKAIAVLKQAGINSALINAGGDIYAMGQANKARKWQVGVQHPRKKDSVLTILELQDKAVATSGDYQRSNHIINPRTGLPCAEIPASVTVLAGDCLTADALATCIFVLGPEKGIELVNQLENTEAIVASVGKDRLEILVSAGLKGRLKFSL